MLSALLAVAPVALAQRGGHAAGFHGSFSAPRSFGGFSGFAPRSFSAAPRMAWTAPRYSMAPGSYSGFRPAYGADRQGWNRRGHYRSPYLGYSGYSSPYGYVNSWEVLPWDLGYPDFTDYDDDTAQSTEAPLPQPEYPAPPDDGYGENYAPPPYAAMAAPATSSAPLASEPWLTLIFKDGQTQQIRNYILTTSDVIVMDYAASGRTPRIPLTELNLTATEQAAAGWAGFLSAYFLEQLS
jgi:hypothetical protein